MNYLPLAIWATFMPLIIDLSEFLNVKSGRELFDKETRHFCTFWYLLGIVGFIFIGFITSH